MTAPLLRPGQRLLLATHNRGKIEELRALLAPRGIELVSAAELGLPEPEETGATLEANAVLKAEAGLAATGLASLADDSGVMAHGLGGAPGVHSARYAGPERDFAFAMRRLVEELAARFGSFERADRRASFESVLALALPASGAGRGEVLIFAGRVDGTLLAAPRGQNGFGYDPLFVPEGHERSFGEMTPAEKKALSHRARAVEAFLAALDARAAPGTATAAASARPEDARARA